MVYDSDLLEWLRERTEIDFEIARGQLRAKHAALPLSNDILSYIQSTDFDKNSFLNSIYAEMAKYKHSLIMRQLDGILWQELENTKFIHFVESITVVIESKNSKRKPDGIILLIEALISENNSETNEPHTIFEIISPSTEAIDRGEKKEEYLSLNSLQEYVLIWQDQPKIEQYLRTGKTEWKLNIYDNLDQTLVLSVGVEIKLSKLYKEILK